MRRYAALCWRVLGLALLVGCDKNFEKGVTGPSGVSISVVDFQGYKPDSVDVTAGTTITFGWNGTNSRPHNFTFTTPGVPASPTQLFGTYQYAFAHPGTYHFFCTVHGTAAEHGVVVVH